jgi:hypothetical protein
MMGRHKHSMMRRVSARRLAPLCVVALMAFVAPLALAAPAGAAKTTTLATLKVTAANVSVKASGKTTYVPASTGKVLHQGDTIRTDASGRAEIDYTDGSLTRLGASTIFTISRLTNNKGGRQTQGTLTIGETWNRAAKVSETGSFEVKAGGTTAAVEGTAFVVTCTAPNPGAQATCTVTAVVDNVNVSSDAWDVTNVSNS